jgi:hypothetical protein
MIGMAKTTKARSLARVFVNDQGKPEISPQAL